MQGTHRVRKTRRTNKRSRQEDVTLRERRHEIARLYLQQHTQAEIGKRLGVNQGTVSRDLKAVQEEWTRSAIHDLDARKRQELERIDALEREAWQAWERSKSVWKKTSKKAVTEDTMASQPDKVEVTQHEEDRCGDARFLEVVMKCIDKRCRILGLDAPVKQALTDIAGKEERDYGPVIYLPHNPLDGPPPEGAVHAGG